MRITESKLRRIIRGVIRESSPSYTSDGVEIVSRYGDYDALGREVMPDMPLSKDEVCFDFIESVISSLEDKGWSVEFSGRGLQGQECHALFRETMNLKRAYGRSIAVDVSYTIKHWFDDYYQSQVDYAVPGARKSNNYNHIENCVNACIDMWEEKNVSLGRDMYKSHRRKMQKSGY